MILIAPWRPAQPRYPDPSSSRGQASPTGTQEGSTSTPGNCATIFVVTRPLPPCLLPRLQLALAWHTGRSCLTLSHLAICAVSIPSILTTYYSRLSQLPRAPPFGLGPPLRDLIRGATLAAPRASKRAPAWDLFLVLDSSRKPPYEPPKICLPQTQDHVVCISHGPGLGQ